MNDYPKRKRPYRWVYKSYPDPVILFVTVCTKNHQPALASMEVHQQLHSLWHKADAWLVGRYVIMPDHVHLFAAPGNLDISLENWIQFWKSQFSKTIKNKKFKWQPSFWDTRLKSWKSYDEKWEYVRQNPVRHGHVKDPNDWPYQGCVWDLQMMG